MSETTNPVQPPVSARLHPLVLLACLVLLAYGPRWVNEQSFGVTPDSFSYLSVAQNVAEGRGLTLSQVDPARTEATGIPQRRPLTQWPPLFPILCALALKAGAATPTIAAAWVTYGSTVLAAVFAWLLVIRLAGPTVALPAALVLAISPGLATVAAWAWSEATALAILAAAFLLLDRFLAAEQPARPPWLPLALLAALGLYTRYSFLFVLPFIALALWLGSRGDVKARLRPVLLFVVTTALLFAPWVMRNLNATGYWDGKAPRPSDQPIGDLLRDTAAHLPGMELPPSLGVALLLLTWLLYRLNVIHQSPRIARYAFLLLSAIGMAILLIGARAINHFDPIGVRLLIATTLLLQVTVIAMAADLTGAPASSARIAGATVWGLLLALNGWYAYHPPPTSSPVFPESLARYLRSSLPPGSVYAGPRSVRWLQVAAPEQLQLTGLSQAMLRTEDPVTYVDLVEAQRKYHLRYLVFPGPPRAGAALFGPLLESIITVRRLSPEYGRIIDKPGWRIIELADLPPEPPAPPPPPPVLGPTTPDP